MRSFIALAALAVASLAHSGLATAQGTTPPVEEVIRIPRAGTTAGLVTRICRPATSAPAPLVVINHGRPVALSREDRKAKNAAVKGYACGAISRVFTSRGYVVAFPLRRSYGETGGADRESSGDCDAANFVTPARAAADDIEAAINHLRTLPFIAKHNTIVAGQSAGGLASMALASRNLPGVAAHINFAGGLGGRRKDTPNNNCSPGALVAAMGAFGRTARQRTLWIYTQNDTYFGPELSGRMVEAFRKGGGNASFEMLPAFEDNGHNLFRRGVRIWEPIVARWLETTKTGSGRPRGLPSPRSLALCAPCSEPVERIPLQISLHAQLSGHGPRCSVPLEGEQSVILHMANQPAALRNLTCDGAR